MDPLTLTGLALGIAPLIISAVENYEYTFQPFVTYRRYSREIDRFTTRLSTQKTIFTNECQLLLLATENQGNSESILLDRIIKDPNHVSRLDDGLNRKLEKVLGASFDRCIATLCLIQGTLDDISRETKRFEEVTSKKARAPHLMFF
jgi:hypothetical protein